MKTHQQNGGGVQCARHDEQWFRNDFPATVR